MPATYEPIATTTLTSNQATITFTGIPQTFTDILLVFEGTLSTGVSPTFRVGNGSIDTGANYSFTTISGNGTAAQSGRNSSVAYGGYGAYFVTVTAGNRFTAQLHFMNYSNTTTNKTILSRNNVTAQFTEASVALWRSTSGINQIQLQGYNGGGEYASGCVVTLYGIKAA